MSVSKTLLSASTNGRNIKVAATATPGTTIHTCVSGTTAGTYDYVTLYAVNTSASPVVLTVECGGTTSPDDLMVVTIPASAGEFLLFENRPFNNAVVIRAFAATANVINVRGEVTQAVTA